MASSAPRCDAVRSFLKEELAFYGPSAEVAGLSNSLVRNSSRHLFPISGRNAFALEKTMSDRSYLRFNPLHSAPNILTLTRICLAPFLVSAILDDRFALSFGLFVAAGLTDALDGTLARWLKQRTVLGQYLDPVADKLLLSTLFVVLTHERLIPTTVTVLVFGRDVAILVVAAILYAAVGRREFKPTIFGKANTVAQVTSVAAVLLHQISNARWVIGLRVVALDATVGLTVASGLHYAWMVTRRMPTPTPNDSGGSAR